MPEKLKTRMAAGTWRLRDLEACILVEAFFELEEFFKKAQHLIRLTYQNAQETAMKKSRRCNIANAELG